MGAHSAETTATQSDYPWRAVLRTIVAFIVGVAPLLPAILAAAENANVPGATGLAAASLAVTGAVTRVLAVPGVNDLLQRYGVTAWLAATPRG